MTIEISKLWAQWAQYHWFLKKFRWKNRNSVTRERAKSNNFAPLNDALIPCGNREAGRGFFWDLFGGKIRAKLEAGSVPVCDYVFEDVKKLHQIEFWWFSEDSWVAKVWFLIRRCCKNLSLARSSIQYPKQSDVKIGSTRQPKNGSNFRTIFWYLVGLRGRLRGLLSEGIIMPNK